jgi:hypothetical protein
MPVPQGSQEAQEHPDNPEAQAHQARKDHLAHQDSQETMELLENPVNLDSLEAPERREFAQNIAQSMGAFSSRTALDDVKYFIERGVIHLFGHHVYFLSIFGCYFSPAFLFHPSKK